MLTEDQIVEKFSKFLHQYRELVNQTILEGKKSVIVNFSDLDKFDMELGDQLLQFPEETLNSMQEVLDKLGIIDGGHIRFSNLPATSKLRVRDIRSKHLGRFIAIDGLIRQASEVRPEVVEMVFECEECGNKTELIQDDERTLIEPNRCFLCGKKTKFKTVSKDFVDVQKIVLEESPENLRGSEQPSRINCLLSDDLVDPELRDKLTPGNQVNVVGIVKEIPITTQAGKKTKRFDIMLTINYIETLVTDFEELKVTEEEKKQIRKLAKDPKIIDKLVASVAPSIFGFEKVKEGIALQLFGGVRKFREDGVITRGDIHLFLVGDPGSAKSQLLKYVAQLAPKARYVTGKGATGAGLTATVVKDEFLRGWALEAGALVLASGGIGCLHPKTSVLVDNRMRTIGSLFDNNFVEMKNRKGELVQVRHCNLNVPSFEKGRFSVSNKTATKITRKWFDGKLKKIRFASGHEILVTPDHLFIDGGDLNWKQIQKFNRGTVVAPLKLPGKKKKLLILELLPDDWKVFLTKNEKIELKQLVGTKFKKLVDFNTKLDLDRNILSGSRQPTIKQFKEILKYLDIYGVWSKRCFSYGREFKGNRLKVAEMTPELGYVLGFIYGDGSITSNKRRVRIAVSQSIKHKEYIGQYKQFWAKVSEDKLKSYQRKSRSVIRSKEVISESMDIVANNPLIGKIYQILLEPNLDNILILDDSALSGFLAGLFDADGCLSEKNSVKCGRKYSAMHVEILASQNKTANLNLIDSIKRFDCFSKLIQRPNIGVIRITGREDIKQLQDALSDYSVKIRKKITVKKTDISSVSDKLPIKPVADIFREVSKLNKTFLVRSGIWSTVYDYKNERRDPSRAQVRKILDRTRKILPQSVQDSISQILKRDYFLNRIDGIEDTDYSGWVYDLYVPGTHNFFANGVFVHNCVDELDKMGPEDRSAMHEVMEQQTVSVSKANVQATLKAQVSILGAANPKYGRFDPYQPIADQINMPDTLLSRFDLIFPIRDVPDAVTDSKLAEHILWLHKDPTGIKPIIPTDMMRKYIAYARKEIHPVITDEAVNEVKSFFVGLRSKYSSDENQSVPISPRQLEALVRLTEASARMRLSKEATKEDAERAIDLLKFCLYQVGVDPETGKLDIDRLEGVTTASKRGKIMVVLQLLREMEEQFQGPVPKFELIEKAKEKGVPADAVERLIEEMKMKGDIYEPRSGFIQKL